MIIYDSNFAPVLETNGNPIVGTFKKTVNTQSETESYLRNIGEFRTYRILAHEAYCSWLKANYLYDTMDRIFPIAPNSPGAALVEFKGGASLTPSGETNFSYTGISNNTTSTYFDTNYNPSSRIQDINNFSFGVYVQDDVDGGYDIGCNDTTNYFQFSAKNSGAVEVKIGTATDSFATTQGDARGHWIVNVRAGMIYIYWNGIEVGTPTAVMGSLPNLNAYLTAANNNGSAGDLTTRTESFLWIHDGLMSETQVQDFHGVIQNYQFNLNRSNGLS